MSASKEMIAGCFLAQTPESSRPTDENRRQDSTSKQLRLLIDELKTPIGTLLLVVDLQGNLRTVDWNDHLPRMLRLLRIHYGDDGFALEASHDPAGMTDSLSRYFEGDLSVIDRLSVQTRGTPFQREVWSALRTIPCGTTTSYRQLAEQIGRSAAVRAVGMANGSNPVSIVVPCHRVIGSNGSMTGYGGGIHRKLWLLEHERQHGRRTFKSNLTHRPTAIIATKSGGGNDR